MWSIEKHLSKDEHILIEVHPSWLAYVSMYAGMILTSITIIIPILLYLAIHLDQKSTRYIITNKGVAKRLGILSESFSFVRLEYITSIRIRQSFLGRILDFGDIIIDSRGTGDGHEFTWTKVRRPVELRKILEDAKTEKIRSLTYRHTS